MMMGQTQSKYERERRLCEEEKEEEDSCTGRPEWGFGSAIGQTQSNSKHEKKRLLSGRRR